MTLISHEAFRWTLTALTTAGSLWALYDVFKARKARARQRRGPARAPALYRDELFGYAMGIVLALLGLAGVLRFHGVF